MRKLTLLLAAAMFVLCLAGCGSVFSSEYSWSEPFAVEQELPDSEGTEIRNYAGLRKAILELIYSAEEQGQFRFGSYNGSLVDDLAAVCVEIKNTSPMGVYAVEDISYDSSRIVSYYTADIAIEYKKTAEEIAAVVDVSGLAELSEHIAYCLSDFADETVVKFYSYAVDEVYFHSLVSDYALREPLAMPVEPRLSIKCYPESGADRIYALSFDYGFGKSELKEMTEECALLLKTMAGELAEDEGAALAYRAAAALAEKSGGAGSGEDTALAALKGESSSPRALALAWSLLCRELGIECRSVKGSLGGTEHYWNIFTVDGENYHADISRLTAEPYKAFLMSDEDMAEDYEWQRSSYPVCSGSLSAEDLFGPMTLPEETPEPEEGEQLPQPPASSPEPGGEI